MITADNNTVIFTLFLGDLYNSIKAETIIRLYKVEENQTSGNLIPFINFYTNSIIVQDFCLVDLIDEDLLNGKIYLPYFGQYKIEILTKDLLDIDYTLIQSDLFLKKGNNIQYL